ncbi:MAG: HNH endonuclease [Phycisphaeraceae bacterium]|nr:HNH endonuclease [Phycisphaeraceae bacterium]MCW5763480.1 HNH endonuclease [Phycisphaeraceae bacterium]
MPQQTTVLGLDIGSNSVGSAWIDAKTGTITRGISIFPAGVDETDDKRGDPKNANRRNARRTRITLARRAQRKRELRLALIDADLLPPTKEEFKKLLETTDPWDLRRRGLSEALSPYEFGRVLLHLAQRRGALGLSIADPEDGEEASESEDGKVKAAIGAVRAEMIVRKVRTFGEFIAMLRDERRTPIQASNGRTTGAKGGPREYCNPVRNKAGSYERCADRPMIRDEFKHLWTAQKKFGGALAPLLTGTLCELLDNEQGDSVWKHKGLLFGQRRATWDLGTLGRCVLHPEERCIAHADRYASRFLVIETVNNLRIIERGQSARPLTPDEREKIIAYLSGPLGMIAASEKKDRKTGEVKITPERPKRTVSVTDLRNLMGTSAEGWGRASKTSHYRFNIESDDDRTINTDWFSREIVHGAIGAEAWDAMSERMKDGFNRAILRFDPDEPDDAKKLKAGVMSWGGLDEERADRLIEAWKTRPRPDARRLNMSRRAVRNILSVMEQAWTDEAGTARWITQIEVRKVIAADDDSLDVQSGRKLDDLTRRRYATGAKGATARDRYYMGKHTLRKPDGSAVIGPDGHPLAEPPPAPLISNPVVRKAIHEVRRHLVEYMTAFGRKPDTITIELAREAKMGAKDADKLLFKNRLRNRIRNEIVRDFKLDAPGVTSTQQRAAVDRVILCVQQGGVCPLCGQGGLTTRNAANGEGCEVAHIIPRASGGHNGLSNIVLSHTKCNREMGRRTPRQYFNEKLPGGFDEGLRFVEGIYVDRARPKPSELKSATGEPLWSAYFIEREDRAKLEQFKKDIKDIQDMTNRQEAATKYAARQVMAYLADALYDGTGLPERGGTRRIYATDGLWTSRLRREWGLFFDPHDKRSHDLSDTEKHIRQEKDRGDHRHHAIDAIVIALCTPEIQRAWDAREKQADIDGINTADEEQMANYRRANPLPVPAPFTSRDAFRAAVEESVYGERGSIVPVCHRPVKRKLIGALHQKTLHGPVLDREGNLTNLYTAKKSVLALTPNHLRLPRLENSKEAIDRLADRRIKEKGIEAKAARKWARELIKSPAYTPATIDPPPEISGIVRDADLRRRLRLCLYENGLDPDNFKANELKKLVEAGKIRHASGVPIKSVVLLRTMSDPVLIDRKKMDYSTGRMIRDDDPASKRAYLGGNNHHVEIRVAPDKTGQAVWTGEIVSAFEAAQRNLARLGAFRAAGVPKPKVYRDLPAAEKNRWRPIIRQIEQAHPIVDRRDNDKKGGAFLMSLSEGETLYMADKTSGIPGYFVVAMIFGTSRIILVPHWDARAATGRKDSEGRKVSDSVREQFEVSPNVLKSLAPPGHPHAVKVRISPLGTVTVLERD